MNLPSFDEHRIETALPSKPMKHMLLVPFLMLAALAALGETLSTESPPAQEGTAKAEAAEERTVIGILHPTDVEDRVDAIQLHLVSISNGSEGIFVVDIGLESPLSRKQVDLMTQRVRQAGEDKVRPVLLKLSARVEGDDPPKITRGRIVGFKARKDAEVAGGALEETLVGDWPDVGFIKFPPDEKEGPAAKEESQKGSEKGGSP